MDEQQPRQDTSATTFPLPEVLAQTSPCTIPSLADWTSDDLDVSPFFDDDEQSGSTDCSQALSLTSHSGNLPNTSNTPDEEWVVRVEDRTITISRLVTTQTMEIERDDDFDRDSTISSVGQDNPMGDFLQDDDASINTDPSEVVALLTTSSSASTPPASTPTTTIPILEDMAFFSQASSFASSSSSSSSSFSASSSSSSSSDKQSTESQSSHESDSKKRFWIADSLHEALTKKETANAIEKDVEQPDGSSSQIEMPPLLAPAAAWQENDNDSSDDSDSLYGQDSSTTSMSEIHLLDMENSDDEEQAEEEMEEYEEGFVWEESSAREGDIDKVSVKEEKNEGAMLEESMKKEKELLVLCARESKDRFTEARQRLTIESLKENGIPYQIVYGDDPENASLRDALFELAGTKTGTYPQLFMSTPDGETLYWGDWNDLMDESSVPGGPKEEDDRSFWSATDASVDNPQVICEFVWDRALPFVDVSTSHSNYEEDQETLKDTVQHHADEASPRGEVLKPHIPCESNELKEIPRITPYAPSEMDKKRMKEVPAEHAEPCKTSDADEYKKSKNQEVANLEPPVIEAAVDVVQPYTTAVTEVHEVLSVENSKVALGIDEQPVEKDKAAVENVDSLITHECNGEDSSTASIDSDESGKGSSESISEEQATPDLQAYEQDCMAALISAESTSTLPRNSDEAKETVQTEQVSVQQEVAKVAKEEVAKEVPFDKHVQTQRDNPAKIGSSRPGMVHVLSADELEPTTSTGTSELRQPAISSTSGQPEALKVYSTHTTTSLFSNDVSNTNASPIYTNSSPERIERANAHQKTPSAKLDVSDAMMEKVKPTSALDSSKAVMEKKSFSKSTSKTKESKTKEKRVGQSKANASKVQPKVQVANPAMNCYEWYSRMGRPTRDGMKRRVNELPKSCGVEIEHIDLLPWDATGTTLQHRALREILMGTRGKQQ